MLIVDYIVQVLHHLEKKHFEFHRSTFIRNYISLYDLLTSGKIDKKYLLEFASMIGMPLDEDLQNFSEISIINKAVDYFESKRTINKKHGRYSIKKEKRIKKISRQKNKRKKERK